MLHTESLAHTGASVFPFLMIAVALLIAAICVMVGAKVYSKKKAQKDLLQANSSFESDTQSLNDGNERN